jgi:hypothetical protein
MRWPNQRDVNTFYGNPRGAHFNECNSAWYAKNIVFVVPPFPITYEGKSVHRIPMHRKCAASFARVLDSLADRGNSGPLPYGGSFNYRLIRGGNSLSMHAYGCAVDFDVEHNPMGHLSAGGYHANSPLVLAFKHECWTWGGDWKSRPDPMHFQACYA